MAFPAHKPKQWVYFSRTLLTLPFLTITPMNKTDLIKPIAKRLINNVYKTFDKLLLAIPEGQLDFRATEENMSFKQISNHLYQSALVFTNAMKTGEVNFADVTLIAYRPNEVESAAELVAYGQKVKDFIQQTVDSLTEEEATRPIKSKFGEMNALRIINVMLEEAIHHRGQFTIYLRLLGVKPPSIYDYN
jgi:uncharacterized damage-inducible protein DinB